jgi:fumarate hydratase class I
MKITLNSPIDKKVIKKLKVGDLVFVSGTIFTMRDAAMKYLAEGNKPPINLKNAIIFNCGPIVVKKDTQWTVKAAGPTTSTRIERYMPYFIEKLGIGGVIGKGGMSKDITENFKKHNIVYLHTIGGAGRFLAEKILRVKNVYLKDKFGQPEAIWEFEVKDFPTIVTIDCHGNNLHNEILKKSQSNFQKLHQSKIQKKG